MCTQVLTRIAYIKEGFNYSNEYAVLIPGGQKARLVLRVWRVTDEERKIWLLCVLRSKIEGFHNIFHFRTMKS